MTRWKGRRRRSFIFLLSVTSYWRNHVEDPIVSSVEEWCCLVSTDLLRSTHCLIFYGFIERLRKSNLAKSSFYAFKLDTSLLYAFNFDTSLSYAFNFDTSLLYALCIKFWRCPCARVTLWSFLSCLISSTCHQKPKTVLFSSNGTKISFMCRLLTYILTYLLMRTVERSR